MDEFSVGKTVDEVASIVPGPTLLPGVQCKTMGIDNVARIVAYQPIMHTHTQTFGLVNECAVLFVDFNVEVLDLALQFEIFPPLVFELLGGSHLRHLGIGVRGTE